MEYVYKFSIIIAVYNVEKYIKATIETVLNQTIGFEKNAEIILVDDGSTDNSKIICKEFEKQYPQNIKYIYKTNGGVSSARNLGIKNARGKYFNFLDSDDLLHENALNAVYEFFERNKYEIDMVTLPIVCFEKQNGLYHRYLKFGNTSDIINLEETPQDYIFSCAASFYKSAFFKENMFNTNLRLAEDLYFNTKLFLKNPKFGIISQEEAVYYYRKRYSENSITNKHEYAENWLVNVLEYLYKELLKTVKNSKGPIPEFLQYIFIYNIVKRIDMAQFVTKNVLNKFFRIAEKVLSSVSDEILICYQYNDYFYLAMMLMIKNKEYDINKMVYLDSQNNVCIKGQIIKNAEDYNFQITSIKVENEKLIMEGFFNDIIGTEFRLYYKHKNEFFGIKTNSINNSFLQKRFFDIVLGRAYLVKVEIPLEKKGIHSIVLKTNNSRIPIGLKNVYNGELFEYQLTAKTEEGNIHIKMDSNEIHIEGDLCE